MDKSNNKGCKSSTTWPSDALQAVKIDPAVIEAQITVDTNKPVEPEPSPHAEEKPDPEFNDEDHADDTKSMFEEMVKAQKAAILSLAPEQFDMLMKYADILRLQRYTRQKNMECAFCKKNGRLPSWYTSHILKDNHGRVQCPVLREFRCRRCGAVGDYAHTNKYCPKNQENDRWSR